MDDKKLNVGVIGAGGISVSHLSAYKAYPRANLYSICDIDEDWLPDAAKLYGVDKAYTDYMKMLQDPGLDAVSICLPTRLHAEAAINALKMGKHVLCEKPMATNAQDAREMKKHAEISGKKLMISQNQRFEDNVQLIKQYAERGFFGEIYVIRAGWRRQMGITPACGAERPNGKLYNRNFFNEKDNGGGVLRDLGSHLIDLSMYVAGFLKPIDVAGSLFRKFYPDDYVPGVSICDSEDLALAQVRFDSGMTMQLEVSFGSYVAEELVYTEIYGTKGGASRRNGKLKFIEFESESGSMVDTHITKYESKSKCVQQRFVDAVLDNTDSPVPPDEGVKIIELLDAIYSAAGEIIKN